MLKNPCGDAGSVGLRGSNESGILGRKPGEIYNQLDLRASGEMEGSRVTGRMYWGN